MFKSQKPLLTKQLRLELHKLIQKIASLCTFMEGGSL